MINSVKSIFLSNKSIKQTIFKNTFWIASANFISKLLKFILIVYVIRLLGATDYGKFSFALAFISLFVIFYDFGLSNIITKEFSQEEGEKKKKEFFSVVSLKIILSLITLVLIITGSFLITSDFVIRKTILILAIFTLIGSFSDTIYAFFRARQKMEYESWAIILETLVVFGLGFLVIFKFPSIINLSYGYLLSALVSLVFVFIIFSFKLFPLKIYWDRVVWKKFLIMSWPLALVGLFSTIYVYIDSVMMGYWGQILETGWYNAAYRIINTVTVPMGFIALSFFPVLSKLFRESKERFQNVWNFQMELMIMLVIPLIMGGVILAPEIIIFAYGESFFPSILVFQILILINGPIFLSSPLGSALIIYNQQKKMFLITFLGALMNIILNLILIPKFSLYGAAVATLITYVFLMFLFFICVFKYTSIKPLNLKVFLPFAIAIFSGAVMSFSLLYSKNYNLNIFYLVFGGIFIYFLFFLPIKFLSKKLIV